MVHYILICVLLSLMSGKWKWCCTATNHHVSWTGIPQTVSYHQNKPKRTPHGIVVKNSAILMKYVLRFLWNMSTGKFRFNVLLKWYNVLREWKWKSNSKKAAMGGSEGNWEALIWRKMICTGTYCSTPKMRIQSYACSLSFLFFCVVHYLGCTYKYNFCFALSFITLLVVYQTAYNLLIEL